VEEARWPFESVPGMYQTDSGARSLSSLGDAWSPSAGCPWTSSSTDGPARRLGKVRAVAVGPVQNLKISLQPFITNGGTVSNRWIGHGRRERIRFDWQMAATILNPSRPTGAE
jgi:hypothetical protein